MIFKSNSEMESYLRNRDKKISLVLEYSNPK